MNWEGQEKPPTEEPGEAIQVEKIEWAEAPKGGNAWPPDTLKGQIDSNDEMLGGADRDFQAEDF